MHKANWSVAMDVGGWLRKLGLEQYGAAFSENNVDDTILPSLTTEDLKELGVASVGHRRKLLDAIAALHGQSQQTAVSPNEVRSTTVVAAPPNRDIAERRPITVMFCDLVGSTSLAGKLDAEDWRDLVGAYLDKAAGAVDQYGGHVLKKLGDGIMALFGYPKAQENDAERAARAGLAILRALEDLNAKNVERGLPALGARIGLESGPVVVDTTGEVFGDAPNVAARVQSAAEPGTLVVTASVQRQVAGLFIAEDKGPHELKGVSGTPTLYRLVRASGAGRRAGARSQTPLVGREEELTMLARRWERAKSGDGQFLQIVGEPGLGKSRLVEEFRIRLGETPHTWVEWASSQLLQNTPLHPLAEWGRQRFVGEARLAELEAALAQVKLDPAEYVPLLAPLLDIPLPEERTPKYAADELLRRQLGAGVSWILAAARAQPIILAVEDLHWADPTSLDLLKMLAERGAQARLLIVATNRPEFHAPWTTRSHHGVIALTPLDRAQIAIMVAAIAERHTLAKDVVEGLSDRTGGVPLFIEEVTRLLLEGGAQTIPPTLQQSLAARLDRLGDAREVAQIGSVLGREFSYALLQAVADRPSAVLDAGLEKLAEVDLLFVEGTAPQSSYRFKHALIQDAAYESLLKTRRQALHRRAAEALVATPDPQPELLARHCTEAGQIEKAAGLWGKAGERSLARSAVVEACEQLNQALDLLASLPQTSATRRQQLKLQIALANALMQVKGYAAPEPKAAFERARLFMERAEALGEAPEDPLLLFSFLWGVWSANYVRFNGEAMRSLASQFMELAERRGAKVPLMVGHRLIAMSALHTGEIAGSRSHFDRTIALYDPAEHRALAPRFGQDIRVAALSFRGEALWILGYPELALADAERSITDAQEINHGPTLMYALHRSVIINNQCGNYTAASKRADEVVALATQKRAGFWKVFGMLDQGIGLALTGNPMTAVQNIISAIDVYRSMGSTLGLPEYLWYLAKAHAQLCQMDDAWRCVDEAKAIMRASGETWFEAELHRLSGEIALMGGNPDAEKAEASFQHAVSVARQQQAKAWELRAAMSMARLWRDQGKRDEARELLAPVYGWFTEGFDTLDLKQAKALLEALA
jgi:class 3 adenylate cyclase/predicted ATPase